MELPVLPRNRSTQLLPDHENGHSESPGWQPQLLTAEQEETARVGNYWRILRKRARLVAAVFCIIVGGTILLIACLRPIYTATGVVLIEPHTPPLLELKAPGMGEAVDAAQYDDQYYENQYRILDSRSLASQVIRKLHLESGLLNRPHRLNLPGFLHPLQGLADGLSGVVGSVRALLHRRAVNQKAIHEFDSGRVSSRAINAYLKTLKITPGARDHLVSISFSSFDPVLAARVVRAHIGTYIGRGMEIHTEASRTAQIYLRRKLTELKDRLEKSEAALNNYRRSRGIVTPTLHDKTRMIMGRYTDLSDELTRVRSERLAREAQVTIAQKGDYQSLPAVIQNPLIQKLKEDVAGLSSHYAEKRSEFTDAYRPLADLKSKLEEAERRLNAETANVVRGIYSSYQSEVVRQQGLEAEIGRLQSQIMALNDASLQDAVLTRDVEANDQLYQSVLHRLNEIGVSEEVPTTNVSVVDRAEVPVDPSSPRIALCLGLSVFFGLFSGFGLVTLLEYLDDRFQTPEEVERYLRIPSLGVVPDFALSATRNHLLRRPVCAVIGYASNVSAPHSPSCGDASINSPAGHPPAAGSGLKSEAPAGRELAVINPDLSWAAEVYRTIRTGLLFSRAGSPPKTILFVSALPGEGKTVTAANVAVAFAQMGARTILVDADLRRPQCHRVFTMEKPTGLSEALAGQLELEQTVSATPIKNLFLLGAGSVPPNPAELLGSARMREVLECLSRRFDYVVIDSSPVAPVSDAVIVSTMVDGVILVVGPDTPKEAARKACARFSYVRVKVFGAVLNRVSAPFAKPYAYPGYYRAVGRPADLSAP